MPRRRCPSAIWACCKPAKLPISDNAWIASPIISPPPARRNCRRRWNSRHPAPVVPPLLAGQTIAVARDAAYGFLYPANLDTLRALGAQLEFFSPLAGDTLPTATRSGCPVAILSCTRLNWRRGASCGRRCRFMSPPTVLCWPSAAA